MRKKFLEILKYYQNKSKESEDPPKTINAYIKYCTIESYKELYNDPGPSLFAKWLKVDHSSIIYLRDSYTPPAHLKYQIRRDFNKPKKVDFSSFMNTTYHFVFKYVNPS